MRGQPEPDDDVTGSHDGSLSPAGSQGDRYVPPPPTSPPAAGWRPARVEPPPTPRELPRQDEAAIDQAEHGARVFTRTTAIIAALTIAAMIAVLSGDLLR